MKVTICCDCGMITEGQPDKCICGCQCFATEDM